MATTSLAQMKNGQQGMAKHQPQKTILDFLSDERVKKGIAAVAGKYMNPDRMLRLCVNAVKKTPLLMQCDPQTVLGAMMTSTALGLEPNTPQQQAFLIPYKRRAKDGNRWIDVYDCQFQIGYRGFITLAHRSPVILTLQAEAIHEGDFFEHMLGTESFLKYRKALKDRGEMIGAFSYTKLEGGAEMATVLPIEEIVKIRSKSETYNALLRAIEEAGSEADRQKAQKKFDDTPWVLWEDDMAAKSAIKKHCKQLPLAAGDLMYAAAQIENAADNGTIDLKGMADPDLVRSVIEGGEEPPIEGETAEVTESAEQQTQQQSTQQETGKMNPASKEFFKGIE